jgi:hypothetical protein
VDIWEEGKGQFRIKVIALQEIEIGEEIFNSYLDEDEQKLPAKNRQEILKNWFDTCHCTSCKESALHSL